MRLIDAHCHLTHGRLRGDLPGVLERARQAGVVACICAAGTIKEAQAAAALARTRTDVFSTAGVHPHDAKDAAEGYLRELERLAAGPGVVAIGETGLDYHYDFSPRDAQRRVFAEQLALAGRLGRPVVIHTREAFDDTLAIVRESGLDGAALLFHSFTEDSSCAARALDLGATISFSGIVTFRNAEYLRAAAALAPDDRLLIETDAPYLSPEPVRKMKTNEPANVAHVAACLAAVRGIDAETLGEMTTANAVRFFGLSLG